MAIADIDAYYMPEAEELPSNVAPWRIDRNRAALLIHDMQGYFLAPYDLRKSPARELLAHTAELKRSFEDAEAPVLYSVQPGGMMPEERGLMSDFWGPGMTGADVDRRISGELRPNPQNTVITKWRASAFFRTDLLNIMQGLGRDQLVIAGIYAHVGILMTANDAYSNDVQPFVVADAIADFSRQSHMGTIEYLAGRCAVVTTTSSVLDSVSTDRD